MLICFILYTMFAPFVTHPVDSTGILQLPPQEWGKAVREEGRGGGKAMKVRSWKTNQAGKKGLKQEEDIATTTELSLAHHSKSATTAAELLLLWQKCK